MDLVETRQKPSLVVLPHALLDADKELFFDEFLPGETIGRYVDRLNIYVPDSQIIVELNGFKLHESRWRYVRAKHGDIVHIRLALPAGGGGDNKVLNSVLTIAVIAASFYVPGALGLAAGSFGAAAAQGAIMVGGMLLVNAIAPIGQQMKPLSNQNKYETSPTYSISGGRNTLRPYQPMPVIFGSHRVVPDLGAKPYAEWVGNVQYFNQVFNFGLNGGRALISDMRIGDTPIGNFKGVQVEVSREDGKLSMFPGNVDTVQGFNVSSGDGWVSRTTPNDVESISVELAAQVYRFNDDGSVARRSVDVELQYRLAGASSWTPFSGDDATAATHYWSLVEREGSNEVQIGFGSTSPGEHTDGEVVSERTIYSLSNPPRHLRTIWRWKPHPHAMGLPWHGIAPDPFTSATSNVRLTGSTQDVVRRTVSRDVPLGQYEIRIRKVTADVNDSREKNDVAVGQILCFQRDDADYFGQLRVGVRIQASEQLQGHVEQFNAYVETISQAWIDGAWRDTITSNPAWLMRDFYIGRRKPDGSRMYGGGNSPSQVDEDAIKEFAYWCDRKDLQFDFVLDSARNVGEMLESIATAGRGSVSTTTGKMSVIWDDDESPIVAMIGPFNIKANSFSVSYNRRSDVDEVVGTFTNQETWEVEEVRSPIPGATVVNNPLRIDLEGITRVDQAGRAANLLAASQVFHTRRVAWEMDIEHLMCRRGDVVLMSHDLTQWSYSKRLLSRPAQNVIQLTDKIPSGGSGLMMLRSPGNEFKLFNVTSDVGEVDTFTISGDLDGFPLPNDPGYEDVPPIDWAVFFDPLGTPGRRIKVTSVVPSKDGSAALQGIDDDPNYYACEGNPFAYTPRRDGALLSGIVFAIRFNEQIVNLVADLSLVTANWTLSVPSAARVAISVNGNTIRETTTEETSISVQAQTGNAVTVTVTPVSAFGREGVPMTQTYVVAGLLAPLPPITGLNSVFREGLTRLIWNRVVDVRNPDYEVRLGLSWGNSRMVGVAPNPESLTDGNGTYFVAARYAANGRVIYGPASQIIVAGSVMTRNVIVTHNEAPAWTGSKTTGVIVVDGELTLAPADPLAPLGGVVPNGVYQTAVGNRVDVGYEAAVRVIFDIDFYTINRDQDILSMADILAETDILSGSYLQNVSVHAEVRASADGATWTEWSRFVSGEIKARWFDARLIIETRNPRIVPFVRQFTWKIDVPDLIQTGSDVAIPVGGMRITFPKPYHTDKPNVTFSIIDAIDGDRGVMANIDRYGFDFELKNVSTSKSGVINWASQNDR